MKISHKLFLILLTVVIVLVLLCSLIPLNTLKTQIEQEKMRMSVSQMKQISYLFDSTTDQIERYLYDHCKSENIAYYVMNANQTTTKESVTFKLDSIIRNSPYISDGLIVGANGIVFSSSHKTGRDAFLSLDLTYEELTRRDIIWYEDSEGNLFVCRNVNQIYPYTSVGKAIFLVDKDHLRKMVGMHSVNEGEVTVFDQYGNIVLSSNDTLDNPALSDYIVETIHDHEALPRVLEFQNTLYYIFAVSEEDTIWSVIYTVEEKELFESFYRQRYTVTIIALALMLGCGIASYSISYVFTRNLRRLKKQVNKINKDTPSHRIPNLGRDEIGELGNDFNDLLERLESMYLHTLQKREEEQKIKYELLDYKYRSLQSQISPHFLCNILSSISFLSTCGMSQQVEQLAIDASHYLRGNLNSNDKKYSTVSDELRLVQEFVALYENISATTIRLTISCSEDLLLGLLPNMLLQPIVENSLKHGIPPQSVQEFLLNIQVYKIGHNRMCIKISDNGIGFSDEVIREFELLKTINQDRPKLIGFGTAGALRRLEIQYKDFVFDIKNKEGGGAETTIVVPFETEPANEAEDEVKV